MVAEGETRDVACEACGAQGLVLNEDGFFYCIRCGSMAEDIIETGDEVANYTLNSSRGVGYGTERREGVAAPIVNSQDGAGLSLALQSPETLKKEVNAKAVGDAKPDDSSHSAGLASNSPEVYCNEVRGRYVLGLQLMVQLQCEALVKKCGANQMVAQICGPIWLRFVAASGVFHSGWSAKTIEASEAQREGDPQKTRNKKFRHEPHNTHQQRKVVIWLRSLKKSMHISSSLAISFLACHVAREPILPTDIIQWSIEGKLPYFSAFAEIEKSLGKPGHLCPLSSSFMFRPDDSVSSQKLESLAASIAQTIGLELPPVNFDGIASRYLNMLSLPKERILSQARLIQEWSMPPDLWLSSNIHRLPTRLCVMSILIVAIRILYNINGFGVWEKTLSGDARRPRQERNIESSNDFDTKDLLQKLYKRYSEIGRCCVYEHSKDLETYLKYCKDVVFAGLEPAFDDKEEAEAIERLWIFYQENKDFHRKRSVDSDECERDSQEKNKKLRVEGSGDTDTPCESSMYDKDVGSGNRTSVRTYKERAIRRLKQDMEENRFEYLPPRLGKRLDYLHYTRKQDDGALSYVAHADYYILIRVCAKVAQIDIRLMHKSVFLFEKRLAWLEKRIAHCLSINPPEVSCEFCSWTQDTTEEQVDAN